MFRHIVVLAFCTFFPLPGVTQITDSNSEPALDMPARDSGIIRSAPSQGVINAHIFVRRLRVPHKAWKLYEKALAAWERDASGDAERKLDQALKIDANFPDALTFRAAIWAREKQWDSAEQSLEAAIHSDPDYYPAYVILASVYNSQERFNEAEEATGHALAAGGDTWSVQYEIARALIGKGQFRDALVVTDSALRCKHGGLMHLARAHALLGLQRYPEAAVDLRTYLHDEPTGEGSPDARNLLVQLQSFTSR